MSAFQSSASGFDTPLMHSEFMAFVTDETSFAVLRLFAERQGFGAATVQMGGPDLFAQMLEHTSAPKLALIDIDGLEDPIAAVARIRALSGGEHKIVAVGSANDVGLYRRLSAVGISDYLVKPLTSDVLAQAYALALRSEGGSKSTIREARIIVFIGSRGGVGASTLAVNCGWLLAHKLKFQCALLDLDMQFGTSALALDLEPGRGLKDVVGSPQRVDSLMVASSMVAASDQFSVLGAEEPVDDQVTVDGTAITALLKELSGNFDFIVIDLPRHLLSSQKRLLAAAHEIVLVSEMSLAGIRDTLRIKNAIASLGSSARLTVASSRTSALHPAQVDAVAFEKGAQIKIDFAIPEDSKAVALAANSGKALGAVVADAAITKALLLLTAKLSNKSVDAVVSKKGFLGFFGNSAPKAKKPSKGSKKQGGK